MECLYNKGGDTYEEMAPGKDWVTMGKTIERSNGRG